MMVGAGGFELPTSCSQSKCSTRLSYAPISITEMLSGVPEPIRQASNQHVHKARGNRTIKRLDLGAKRPWTRVRTLLLGWWPARCSRRPTGSERPICVWLVPRRLRTASQVSSTVQHDTVAAGPNFSSINSYDKIVRPLVAVKTDRLNFAEADGLLGTSSVCETRHGRRVQPCGRFGISYSINLSAAVHGTLIPVHRKAISMGHGSAGNKCQGKNQGS